MFNNLHTQYFNTICSTTTTNGCEQLKVRKIGGRN